MKVFLMVLMLVGVVASSAGYAGFREWFVIR
jgi:hypothetical protein